MMMMLVTLCDPMDCRLLCPWDFQARILEWVAIPSSRGQRIRHELVTKQQKILNSLICITRKLLPIHQIILRTK